MRFGEEDVISIMQTLETHTHGLKPRHTVKLMGQMFILPGSKLLRYLLNTRRHLQIKMQSTQSNILRMNFKGALLSGFLVTDRSICNNKLSDICGSHPGVKGW